MASKAFKVYLDNFMKLLLDNFIVLNDMTKHFLKLWHCFEKC